MFFQIYGEFIIRINFKRYGLYLLRWQLSTIILAPCIFYLGFLGAFWAVVVANLIGGLIFFWPDKYLFQSEKLDASWQVKEKVSCFDCGLTSRGYRLVVDRDYNRLDSHPQFRCEKCSSDKEEKRRNS